MIGIVERAFCDATNGVYRLNYGVYANFFCRLREREAASKAALRSEYSMAHEGLQYLCKVASWDFGRTGYLLDGVWLVLVFSQKYYGSQRIFYSLGKHIYS